MSQHGCHVFRAHLLIATEHKAAMIAGAHCVLRFAFFSLTQTAREATAEWQQINSKLNFAGKHDAVLYRYHFVLSYRFDLFRVLSKCRTFKKKKNTYINRAHWYLSMALFVFFIKTMGVSMLLHRTGFLHTFFGKYLFYSRPLCIFAATIVKSIAIYF